MDPTSPYISYWITTEDLHENNNCHCQQVMPHWVKDCILANTLLPVEDYRPSCFIANNNLPTLSRSKSVKRKLEFRDEDEEFFSCHSDLSNSGSDTGFKLISTPKPKKRLKISRGRL